MTDREFIRKTQTRCPPLPFPATTGALGHLYTADQMRSYARDAARKERESTAMWALNGLAKAGKIGGVWAEGYGSALADCVDDARSRTANQKESTPPLEFTKAPCEACGQPTIMSLCNACEASDGNQK